MERNRLASVGSWPRCLSVRSTPGRALAGGNRSHWRRERRRGSGTVRAGSRNRTVSRAGTGTAGCCYWSLVPLAPGSGCAGWAGTPHCASGVAAAPRPPGKYPGVAGGKCDTSACPLAGSTSCLVHPSTACHSPAERQTESIPYSVHTQPNVTRFSRATKTTPKRNKLLTN